MRQQGAAATPAQLETMSKEQRVNLRDERNRKGIFRGFLNRVMDSVSHATDFEWLRALSVEN
jgi:hypothetical protein